MHTAARNMSLSERFSRWAAEWLEVYLWGLYMGTPAPFFVIAVGYCAEYAIQLSSHTMSMVGFFGFIGGFVLAVIGFVCSPAEEHHWRNLFSMVIVALGVSTCLLVVWAAVCRLLL